MSQMPIGDLIHRSGLRVKPSFPIAVRYTKIDRRKKTGYVGRFFGFHCSPLYAGTCEVRKVERVAGIEQLNKTNGYREICLLGISTGIKIFFSYAAALVGINLHR